MLLVENKIAEHRLDLCKKCTHFVSKTASCGTLILGNTITHKKKKIKLCGCAMPIKTKLKIGSCPIGKWESEFERELILQLKEELNEELHVLSHDKNVKLTELYNKFTGENKKLSTCTPCVKKMVDTLNELLKDI